MPYYWCIDGKLLFNGVPREDTFILHTTWTLLHLLMAIAKVGRSWWLEKIAHHTKPCAKALNETTMHKTIVWFWLTSKHCFFGETVRLLYCRKSMTIWINLARKKEGMITASQYYNQVYQLLKPMLHLTQHKNSMRTMMICACCKKANCCWSVLLYFLHFLVSSVVDDSWSLTSVCYSLPYLHYW